jgi:hypothetical protein
MLHGINGALDRNARKADAQIGSLFLFNFKIALAQSGKFLFPARERGQLPQ